MPRVRKELGGLVLVETVLTGPCIRSLEQATSDAGLQVPWQVTLLTSDGRQLVRRLFLDEPDTFPARVVFFLHYFELSQPLQGEFGAIALPRPKAMPSRLASIVDYVPVD